MTAAGIAKGKLALTWSVLFFRAILCNALVCLAVWLSFAARDVTGLILAILFAIAGFVTLGLEHSIANMYLIGVAWLAGTEVVTFLGLAASLAPVTLGNIVGGGLLVGGVYWLCYRQGATA
jgi:formate/nitrite transporter FocA (FNT family)